MMARQTAALAALWGIAVVILAAVSCLPRPVAPVTPTPDYALLETRTEERLAARLTAQAPLPTETPAPPLGPPTPTVGPVVPTPTASPTPAATPIPPVLVYVQRAANDTTNIVAPGQGGGDDGVLTHFPEPWSIDALVWSKRGNWLGFVSSHAYIRSRNNERNVFLMRADGSELRMVTGDYMDPAEAPGPYVTLQGVVEGARGICRVYAQGATNPVETGEPERYAFSLTGVSQTAAWARAVCQDGADTLQGDVDLDLADGAPTVSIPVAPEGRGWREVSLAPGSQRLVGTYYEWHVDEEGLRRYRITGVIYDLESGEVTPLELPEGKSFYGADWSFDGERIIGGLADEDHAYLWEWDAQGKSLGARLTLDNPEDEILAIVRPRWSPRDAGVVFELHRWFWWGDPRFRTDLMWLPDGQDEPIPLVVSAWGEHATHPAWAATGLVVFYQHQRLEGDLSPGLPPYADIWSVSLEEQLPAPWTDDGASYLPAVRPHMELQTP